jgi:hypothetical protein
MASLEFIAIILTGLGLTASIIYYAYILNNANKTRELQLKAQQQAEETRQTQLYMNLWSKWDSEDFMKHYLRILSWEFTGYEDWSTKYGLSGDRDDLLSYGLIETFFEGIGVLVKRGLLDVSMIDDFMSSELEIYWLKMKTVVDGMRNTGWPTWSEYTEYLYNEVMKIRRQQHPELYK